MGKFERTVIKTLANLSSSKVEFKVDGITKRCVEVIIIDRDHREMEVVTFSLNENTDGELYYEPDIHVTDSEERTVATHIVGKYWD